MMFEVFAGYLGRGKGRFLTFEMQSVSLILLLSSLLHQEPVLMRPKFVAKGKESSERKLVVPITREV